jgi:hypothetical protein
MMRGTMIECLIKERKKKEKEKELVKGKKYEEKKRR